MAKVYVTQETPHDFLPAEKWGEVQFLTTDDVSSIKGSIRNQELIDDLRHKLMKFDPDEDYILMTGSPYVSAIVVYLLADRCRYLRFLRWSNRDKEYSLVHLDMRGES